ncbi:partner and localizer of BRCA2 isoform X2 [Terrapene carolina triunguis]|uniref:partner and localizer of BRCA2 isoform X2 n=1 Tax=Terrapene triunguis TaxID=2587831 RepID=UPI000CEFD7A0|nr:partner and localizer of BRCA2 isoform X2 [Terrapene carolina triunguis]
MLAMDDPPAGKALSWQEKEKLKEKLAFLKREYSKTFNRLQRAQRAERVKNYVKKTVAEQNRLLRQEETENKTTELMDKQSPNGGNKPGTCRLQTNTCSDSGTEKKMSVTFKLEPEFFNNEVNLQENSLAESTNSDPENILSDLMRSVIEEKQNQLPRSRMTLVSEGRESACEVPPISAGEALENQMASTEEPGSPVFKGRNTISNTKKKIQKPPRPVIVREEKGLTPQEPQVGDLQEMPEENVFLSVPKPLSYVSMGGNNVQQPVSPCAEDICDSYEPLPQCLVSDIPVSLENIENTGKELACIENQMDREELCRALDLTADNQSSPAGRSNPSTSESRPHKERNHNETNSSSPLNTDSLLDNVEEPLRNQEAQTEAGSPVLEKTPPAAESALSSCTMIEGLLFPVEYYVRTTRRMSNCQRKVDLEAVILSQLGRSRKGLRSKQKQINSDQLYQEIARSDVQARGTPFPFLGAESDPVSSSSSQKSLPPSDESSTSSGSLSQKTVISTKQAKGKSWRRGWGSTCRPALNGSQARPETSDLTVLKENSHLLSNDSQREKENCEGDPERSPICKTRVLVPAAGEAPEAEMIDIIWPTEADLPDGSQTFSKCHQPPLEHIQNPLQGNSFLNPWDEAFPSPTRDLEANVNVSQADKQPVGHIRNQCVQKVCRAEQLPTVKESLPQHDLPTSSVKRKVRQGSKGKRGRSQQMDLEGPTPLGHLGRDPMAFDPPFRFQNEMLSVKWLPSKLDIKDFQLPDEEFGLLKFEKLQSCTVKQLEPFVPSGSEHWLQSAGDTVTLGDTRLKQVNTEGKSLENSFISPSETMSPKQPHLEGQLHKKGLSPRELLLTPASTVSAGAINQLESQIHTPAFPVLGATPAILSLVHNETLPDTLSVLPLQVKTNLFKEPASHVVDGRECNNSTGALHSDSCRPGSDCRSDEAVTLQEYQQPGNGSKECCSAENKLTAEQLAVALSDNLRDRRLQLASKLKNPSSSCAVDVSTVWWESAGCTELCIVTACETSISLWKPLASNQWSKVYTWHLTEIPVIQIVPLPDVCNLVCVALGDLEIGEIRLLLCSSEDGSLKQSLVKTGNIKAVLGLTNRRLVSSSGTLQDQQIEIISVSEAGSNERQTLMPPEETILAFAEVEGIRDALVGTTAVNSLVVWNLKTGQILKKMHVGYSYPASICHRAYSDSGLLFVVLSHPHAKENESCGNPAFRMRVFNPKTARSTGVMFFSLPPGHSGRYLEGEAKGVSAAAVLTSGAIAVWDLFSGQCTALLPPNADGNWSLVRWSVTDSCLLAGQKDGSVYVYHYSQAKAVGKSMGNAMDSKTNRRICTDNLK